MGVFIIVGVISKNLKDLLFYDLSEAFNAGFFINDISLASLKEIKDNAIGSVRLSLFLCRIVKNVYIRNRSMENFGAGGNKYPLLALYNLIIRKCTLTSNPLSGMGFS
jgi:hypothetical protein